MHKPWQWLGSKMLKSRWQRPIPFQEIGLEITAKEKEALVSLGM